MRTLVGSSGAGAGCHSAVGVHTFCSVGALPRARRKTMTCRPYNNFDASFFVLLIFMLLKPNTISFFLIGYDFLKFYLACCKASNACDRELFVGHLLDAIFGWRRFKYRIGWLCASLQGAGEGEWMMRKNTKFNSFNLTYLDNSVFLHFVKLKTQ